MKTLVAAAIAWPLLLGSVVWARQDGREPLWTTMVYVVGSKICHQRPERSFHTGGVQWPVCARCAGLYASAPFGAVLALAAARRRSKSWRAPAWPIFIAAAIPTAITLLVEWPGLAGTSNLVRAVTALPLGAAVAFLIVRVAGGWRDPIG
jgi:uncharacterized membrane protein